MDKYKEKNPLPVLPDGEHYWLAERVYERKYGHLQEVLDQVPESLLDMRNYILVRIGGTCIHPNFRQVEGKTRDRPFDDCYIDATEEEEREYKRVSKQDRKLIQAFDTAMREQNTYREEVRDVLASVNTTKQLLELWPEVEEFIPGTLRDPSSIQRPAISVVSLNEALK